MKSNIFIIIFLWISTVGFGQKATIAEENIEKTRAAFLGKWEVLTAGSQAEAKSVGIVGDYFEFTAIDVYPKPVHPSLRAHYKLTGYWHGFGSFADNKERFDMMKGDASYDPTTQTWSFGFQIQIPGDKPNEKKLISKSGIIRGTEMIISSYAIDKDGNPYSALNMGIKLPE